MQGAQFMCSLQISIPLWKKSDSPIMSVLVNSLVEKSCSESHSPKGALWISLYLPFSWWPSPLQCSLPTSTATFLPSFEGPIKPCLPHGTFSDHSSSLWPPSSLSSYSASIFLYELFSINYFLPEACVLFSSYDLKISITSVSSLSVWWISL